jgi:predicted nucleic acid-binding Zn ribbon protein
VMRHEIETMGEENRRKVLLSCTKIDNEETGNLLEKEENDIETLQRSSKSLTHSKHSLIEMIEIGTNVQKNLTLQENTINSAKTKINDTNNLTGEARIILRNSERTERRQRLFMYCAVILVVVGVSVAVYIILFEPA